MEESNRCAGFFADAVLGDGKPFSALTLQSDSPRRRDEAFGPPRRVARRAHRAPGVLYLILLANIQHLFDDGLVIRPAFTAGTPRSSEGRSLTALALNHEALGAPP